MPAEETGIQNLHWPAKSQGTLKRLKGHLNFLNAVPEKNSPPPHKLLNWSLSLVFFQQVPTPPPDPLCRFLGPNEHQWVGDRSRDEELEREEKEGKTIKKKWKGSDCFPSNRYSLGPRSSAHPGEQGESKSNPDSRLAFLDPSSLSFQRSWATRPHVHKEERGAKPCHRGFQQKQYWWPINTRKVTETRNREIRDA